MLSHHYRQVWEYDEEEFEDAEHFSGMISRLGAPAASKNDDADDAFVSEFDSVMDDDLNTPGALRMLGTLLDGGRDDAAARRIAGILGFVA